MNDRPVPHVIVVTLPACHLCHEALAALERMAAAGLLSVEEVDGAGEVGRRLIVRHRPAMAPLVLLDGAYFSAGRLPVKKLTTVLPQATSHAVGA